MILLYDCTNIDSFKQLVFYYNEIIRNSQEIPMIMVGTKCDLSDRQITEKDGKTQADNWTIPHFTVSSKSGFNISKLVNYLSDLQINSESNVAWFGFLFNLLCLLLLFLLFS